MNTHRLVVIWRKHGALPLLVVQILASCFLPNYIIGCVALLWLTLPCGIKIINHKWYLYYLRQLAFIILAILYFIYDRL